MERVGKYILEEPLGAGGMGEVFRARVVGPDGFHKRVAIKRILPERLEREPQLVEMFVSEARQTAQLEHPNIVQVYDFFNANGTYYIAMELVDGSDLHRILRSLQEKGIHLPVEHALLILSELLQALHHAHSQVPPLVHRDVTPVNIFVSYTGHVKLGDFGIAQAAAEATEHTASLAGKLRYMAPERLQRIRADARADLYSAGVVAWELLARIKFPELDPSTGRVPSLSSLRPEIPEVLEQIIHKMLNHDRTARHPSAEAVLSDLSALRTLQSSNLALANWMRTLLPRTTTPTPIPRLSSSTPRVPPAEVPTLPTSEYDPAIHTLAPTVTRDRQTTIEPHRARRRMNRRLALVSGLVVLAGMAMATLLSFQANEGASGARPSEAPTAVPAAQMAPPEPPAPKVHRVELRPEPTSAWIKLDGILVTERTLELAAGSRHDLVAGAAGHADLTVELVVDSDRVVAMTLASLPKPIRRPRKSMRAPQDLERKEPKEKQVGDLFEDQW